MRIRLPGIMLVLCLLGTIGSNEGNADRELEIPDYAGKSDRDAALIFRASGW